MKRLLISAVALALLMSGIATTASAATIINGSFEAPVVPNGWYTNFPAPGTIPGWTVVGVDSAIVNKNFTQNGISFLAQDGQQWIDLAGVSSNSQTSGVSQTITTTIGQTYNVSFYVGSATDGRFFFPATIDLSIAGGSRVAYTNPTSPSNQLNWKRFDVLFVASSTNTTLTFYNGGASNNYNSALDNVQVNPVPLPAALPMLLSGVPGLASMGWYLRRKSLSRR